MNDYKLLEQRIQLLEDSLNELEDQVDAVCDLLEAKEVIKLPVESFDKLLENKKPFNYGGTK